MTHLVGLRRSFPTFRLLTAPFRWVGKSRRRVMGVALMLLLIVTAPPLWWAAQLTGLPDIGDPFDVEAFRTQAIPDDRNAFVLYRRAVALYRAAPSGAPGAGRRLRPRGGGRGVGSHWEVVGETWRRPSGFVCFPIIGYFPE